MTQRGDDRRRADGPHRAGSDAVAAARPAFRRRGFTEPRVATHWAAIVGGALAADSAPERISPPKGDADAGTLHVRVRPGGLAVELQHLTPQVVERVNAFFGYRAIADVKVTQGALPPRRRPVSRPPAPPDPEAVAAAEAAVSGVGDPDLRAALAGLGAALRQHGSDAGDEDR